MTSAITCVNCGMEGKMEVQGSNNDAALNIFQHLGHNPFSGNMHYRCPVCKMVLLVDPLEVLASNPLFTKEPAPCPILAVGTNF